MSKPEQSQVETVDAKKLSIEELKNKINSEVAKSEAAADNPAEKSEKSEEASKTEKTPSKETQKKEQASEENQETPSETETPSDKQKQKEAPPLNYEKSYKDLQSKFTKNNQAHKAEIEALNEKLETLTALVKGKTSESSDEKSIIDEIRAKSPETAQLFERFRDELEARYEKKFDEKLKTEVDPLKSAVSVSKETENETKFVTSLESFVKSDLGVYEADLIQILNERYDSQEDLEVAIRKSPSVFADAKRELADRILSGTVETKSKKAAKPSKEEKLEKKKEEIEKQPARGSKESAPVEGELTVQDAKKMSASDLRKRLPVKED